MTNLIIWLLIFVYLGSPTINYNKKTLIKFVYLLETLVEALSTFK